MADDIQFQFTAQIDQLLEALTEAQSSMESAFASMEGRIEEFSGKFDQVAERASAGFDGVGEALEDVRGKLSSAFDVVGITAAAAAVGMVTAQITELGERATEIRNMAEVLGLTTDQFQAFSLAAEEAGVSSQMLLRAGARLESTFADARAGITAAKDKLLDLGFTADQITDKTFGTNEALGVLHDRLNDSATATETITALTKEFGARAALVAEAIKDYDGSLQGVAAANDKVNANSEYVITRLHEMSVALKETWTWVKNTSGELLVLAADTLKAAGSMESLSTDFTAVGAAAEKTAEVQRKSFAGVQDAIRQSQVSLLELAKSQTAGARTGSEAQIAALETYRSELVAVYGENDEKVQAVDRALVTAERELTDKRKAFLQEWASAYVDITNRNAANEAAADAKVAAEENKLTAERKKFLDSWAEEYKRVTDRNVISEIEADTKLDKANKAAIDARVKDWKTFTHTLESSLDSAIKGMLAGTETFGTAMRNIFNSVLNAIIDKIVNDFVTNWIDSFIEAKIANQLAAASQVSANAAVAATAAAASVAAIPFTGWALAPGVAATTAAEMLSYEGLASAAGGWQVPADTLAMVHKDEKILPPETSRGLDRLINAGAAGVAAGGALVAGDTHVHVHTIDSRSFADYLAQPANRRTIARALATHTARGGGR